MFETKLSKLKYCESYRMFEKLLNVESSLVVKFIVKFVV